MNFLKVFLFSKIESLISEITEKMFEKLKFQKN